jgi:hypothetical protein
MKHNYSHLSNEKGMKNMKKEKKAKKRKETLLIKPVNFSNNLKKTKKRLNNITH